MSGAKCSSCGLVNWASAVNCKRCGTALGAGQSSQRSERSDEEQARLRQSAFKKMKSGAVVTVLFVIALFAIPLAGYKFFIKPTGLVVLLAPVAWFLAGVLELVTKTPFEKLSE